MQDIDDVKRAFADRYYEWAAAEIRTEVAADFPRLRTIGSGAALAVVEGTRSWSLSERETYLLTRLKQIRQRAAPNGELLSAAETQLIKEGIRYESWAYCDAKRDLLKRVEDGDYVKSVAEVRRVMKEALSLSLGESKSKESGVWRYQTRLGAFTLCTDVLTREAAIVYSQSLYHGAFEYWPSNANDVRVFRGISLQGWLGLSADTSWEWMREQEVPSIARSIRDWSEHFLVALPSLLQIG